MTVHEILADAVALLHAGYVLFVVGGLVAILIGTACGWGWVRNFWFRLVHFAAIAVVALEALTGVRCPLTDLERHLRAQAGQTMYEEDFLVYWAHRVLFFDEVPQWVFDLGHVVFALLVLAVLVLAPPRRPGQRRKPNASPSVDVTGPGKLPDQAAGAS